MEGKRQPNQESIRKESSTCLIYITDIIQEQTVKKNLENENGKKNKCMNTSSEKLRKLLMR